MQAEDIGNCADANSQRRGWFDASEGVVHIRRDLGHIERRSTLAHELVHADLQDESPSRLWDKLRQEQRARTIAARELVDLRRLAVTLTVAATEHEVAQRLEVDVAMLRTRISNLAPDEVDYISAYVDRHDSR